MVSLRNVKWGRTSVVLFWAATAMLGLNVVRLTYTHKVHSQNPTSGVVPYTVFRTEKDYNSSGNLTSTNHYVEAVRSDGSSMWRGTTDKVEDRRIDLANGGRIRTNELLGRKSTYSKGGAPIQRSPQLQCATTEGAKTGWAVDGTENIGGHPSVRMVLPGPVRTMTVWYALDAGCAMVQLRLQHETGFTVQELAALIPGEPDAALFQVAASFQEVAPSKLHDGCTPSNAGCHPVPDSVLSRLDNNYYAAQGGNH